MHTCTYTHAHSYTLAHVHTWIDTCIHIHAYIYKHTQAGTYTHTHTYMYKHTHTHTSMRIYTRGLESPKGSQSLLESTASPQTDPHRRLASDTPAQAYTLRKTPCTLLDTTCSSLEKPGEAHLGI